MSAPQCTGIHPARFSEVLSVLNSSWLGKTVSKRLLCPKLVFKYLRQRLFGLSDPRIFFLCPMFAFPTCSADRGMLSGAGFVKSGRFLVHRLKEFGRILRQLQAVADVPRDYGPSHLLIQSVAQIEHA